MIRLRRAGFVALLLAIAGWAFTACDLEGDYQTYCANTGRCPADASVEDDAGGDAGTPDAGSSDAGASDGGQEDAGPPDAGVDAGEQEDAGTPDAGPGHSGLPGCPSIAAPGFTCVAVDEHDPNDILLADGYVFWTELSDGGIRRLAADGGAVDQFATVPGTGYFPLTAADAELFWTGRGSIPVPVFRKLAGASTNPATIPTASGNDCIVAAGTTLVWCQESAVKSCQLFASGCGLELDHNAPSLNYSGVGPNQLAAGRVTSTAALFVVRLHLNGLAIQVGAQGTWNTHQSPAPQEVIAAGSTIGWIAGDTLRLAEVLGDGTLVQGPAFTPDPGVTPRSPVLVSGGVFYILGKRIEFLDLAQDGGTQSLASDIDGLRRIAVDGQFIYFTAVPGSTAPRGYIGRITR
jgi:hypothetical protein